MANYQIPTLGETRKGSQLSKAEKGRSFVWHACVDCGKERWVRLLHGALESQRCRACANRRNFLKYHWSEDEVEFLKSHYIRMTIRHIADYLNKTEREVKMVIARFTREKGELRRRQWRYKTQYCIDRLRSATTEEVCYLAGLIDGEGTISIAKSRLTYIPFISVSNTDRLLLRWLGRFFWQALEKDYHTRERCVPSFRLQLKSFAISPLLEMVEPYLVAKKLQCRLLKDYIRLRQDLKWKGPSEAMVMLREDIRALNTPGAKGLVKKNEVRQKYGEV